MTTDQATYTDQTAAEAAIRELAPDARELTAIETALDNTLHSVFLDEAAGRVLWAYQEPGEDRWTLDVLPAGQAATQLGDVLVGVELRLEKPEWYALHRMIEPDEDMAAMDELYDVQIADIATSAEDMNMFGVGMAIRGRIEGARRRVADAAALRAYYLRRQLTGRHGEQSALARQLGISPSALSDVLTRDAERRDRIREEAESARRDAREDAEQGPPEG